MTRFKWVYHDTRAEAETMAAMALAKIGCLTDPDLPSEPRAERGSNYTTTLLLDTTTNKIRKIRKESKNDNNKK